MKINKKINWAILVSGWGRSARNTIEYFENNVFEKSDFIVLIYEQEPCGAAEKAKEIGVETIQIVKKDFSSLLSYQEKLIEVLKERNIDYIFMIAYKYLIMNEMLMAFPNRILNIHPSLFPSFLGTQTAIQDALDYGVKITGITTHIIDDELDKGIILCQEPIRIQKGDTFETLYTKFAEKGKGLILETIKMVEDVHFK